MSKKSHNGKSKYEWVVFAQSYFLIARLACQELLSGSDKKHSKSSEMNISYETADLFVAIMFNVKHGAEVFIKALGIFAYGTYEEGHDIQQLFVDVKQRLLKMQLTPTNTSSYDEITQEDIDTHILSLDKIEGLVNYFFHLDILKAKIGKSYTISDVKNDFLRYPDSKASVVIDWETLLSYKLDLEDVKLILSNLEQLSRLLNDAGYLYSVHSRRGLSK